MHCTMQVEEQDAQLQHALDAMALDKDTNALAVRTDLPADVFTKGSMLRDETQQTPVGPLSCFVLPSV